MLDVIVRGTTPSLIVDLSEVADFSVGDISAISLVIKHRTGKIELGLDDFAVLQNALSYHFTQAQTLAFTADEILTLDMHVVANGERYKVYGIPNKIKIENTEKNEVM